MKKTLTTSQRLTIQRHHRELSKAQLRFISAQERLRFADEAMVKAVIGIADELGIPLKDEQGNVSLLKLDLQQLKFVYCGPDRREE
jgi:hypothetical protein